MKHNDDWRAHARCRAEEPELFFPVGQGPAVAHQVGLAKAVCTSCDVVDPCLEWALRLGDTEGIVGGTTGEERQALLRGRHRVSA